MNLINQFKKAFAKNNKETENLVTDLKGGDSGLDKADLSGPIKDFIESYQNFLNSLSLDQIVAVFNVLMIGSILLTMFSMSLLLVGDYLIDKFKLETRWPRFARFIRLKQKLNKHLLMYYITILFILCILGLSGNIFMFFSKYFS